MGDHGSRLLGTSHVAGASGVNDFTKARVKAEIKLYSEKF
jgi:hypothetical protein